MNDDGGVLKESTNCGRLLEHVKKICVLSKSAVKRRAVERWLRLSGRLDLDVVYLEARPTECPQPFGKASALHCLYRRMPTRADGCECVYLGIENFILRNAHGRWYDYVAVTINFVTEAGVVANVSCAGNFGNLIPRRFAPRTLPEIGEPLGFHETVGQRIHAADATIAHDDWGAAVAPGNVGRATQIVDALRCLDQKLKKLSE